MIATPANFSPVTVRVLVVTKSLGIGGAERLIVHAARNGDREAIHYEIAYVLSSEDHLVPEVVELGVVVHDLGARGNYDLSWLARLRSLLTAGRFDLVHFHLAYAAGLGRLVVRSLPASRRPVTVYTEHSLWHELPLPVRFLNRVTIGSDGAVLAVSESTRQAMSPATRHRARLVVHGIDREQAQRWRGSAPAVRAELDLAPEDHLLTTVANLRYEKGYDVLLEAVKLLVDRSVPVVAVAAGHGPEETTLRRRHAELGLGDRFRFLGPRDDALRLIAAADAVVLASRWEALPLVVMEALTIGTPVVATAAGGIPEMIVDGRTGLLVPPGDPAALADALERLLADQGLRQRLREASDEASQAYDVRRAVAVVEDVYRSLVATGAGA